MCAVQAESPAVMNCRKKRSNQFASACPPRMSHRRLKMFMRKEIGRSLFIYVPPPRVAAMR